MIKKLKSIPGKYFAMAGAAHASLLFSASSHASGKLSGFFQEWEKEGKLIFPIIMWGFALVGVVIMGGAAWKFIKAEEREPKGKFVIAFFGGAFLTMIGAFALMITASSGANSSTKGVMELSF